MALVSQEVVDRVIPLWNSGKLPYVISEELNISNQTVYRALHSVGIYPDGTGSKMYSEPVIPIECDPVWAAEFRGLFYGEGCAYVARRKWKKGFLYTPSLSVSSRLDNLAMIQDIQLRLGGKIQGYQPCDVGKYKCKPQIRWYVVGYSTVRSIIESTELHVGLLKASKVAEISVLYDLILERFAMPMRLGPENLKVIESGYVRLQDMKRYKGSGG